MTNRVFHKPTESLERIVSVRLTQTDIDLVNALIDKHQRVASDIIRDAIRAYAEAEGIEEAAA